MNKTRLRKEVYNEHSYSNKNISKVYSRLNDKDVEELFNYIAIDKISEIPAGRQYYLYKKVIASLQYKMWNNKTIRDNLINGTTYSYLAHLIDLNKNTKSKAVKNSIYYDETFVEIVVNYIIPNHDLYKLCNSYDLDKLCDGICESKLFKSLSDDDQFEILESFTHVNYNKIFLPHDFRQRYDCIIPLFKKIYFFDRKMTEDIYKQLNDEELFYIECCNYRDSYGCTNKLIYNTLVKNNLPFDSLINFTEIFQHDYNTYENPTEKVNKTILEHLGVGLNKVKNEELQIIKEKFINYYIPIIMKDTTLINRDELYNALRRNIDNYELNYRNFKDLIDKTNEVDKSLLFFIKYNVVSKYTISGITFDQLSKLNNKHVMRLFDLAFDRKQDDKAQYIIMAIKMYLTFGFERSQQILSNKYGFFKKKEFLDRVARLDVSNVTFKPEGKSYLPVINEKFNNLFFSEQNNDHLMEMLHDSNSLLFKYWHEIYNDFNELEKKCIENGRGNKKKSVVSMNKIIEVLEARRLETDKLIPDDCYLLRNTKFLENIMLSNRENYDIKDVINTIVDIYRRMRNKIESSIPYVKGENKSIKYEMMKMDDYRIFDVGFLTGCCWRVLYESHTSLMHAACCRNGRILFFYNDEDELIAFAPLKRNGNLLIINSIERVTEQYDKELLEAFNRAIKDIINISKESNEPIKIACIGLDSSLKPNGSRFPTNEYGVPTIYEKDDPEYFGSDKHHQQLLIVYKEKGFKEKDIISKDPEVSYQDPVEENVTFIYDNYYDRYFSNGPNSRFKKVIDENTYKVVANRCLFIPILNGSSDIKMGYIAKDWYSVINEWRGYKSECYSKDPRVIEEFEKCDEFIKTKGKKLFPSDFRDVG